MSARKGLHSFAPAQSAGTLASRRRFAYCSAPLGVPAASLMPVARE